MTTTQPENPGDGPLAGTVVVDLTRALAGPVCTLILAALGAEVVKIEDPDGGDVARGNAPFVGPDGPTMAPESESDLSLALLTRCRGKESLALDLKHPEARGVFADLVAHADVVVENFSAGTADRLGVGYAQASAANPAIVYCSISGFGQDGGEGMRAMDTLIQALSGLTLASGGPGDPPIRVGVPVADVLTPVYAVVGILAALSRRDRTGVGEHVDVSMLGALTSLVAVEDWAAFGALGQQVRTGPTLPRLAPFGLYRARDGWFALVAPQDKMAAALFEAMGRPELAGDERFATRDARVAHAEELTAEIERWGAGRSAAQAVAALLDAGLPAAPVRTPEEAVRDERVVRRGETVPVVHPDLGEVPGLMTAGLPVRFAHSPQPALAAAPRLGEHTDALLARIARYGPDRIAALRSSGAL